jgi:rSAM/selenodomain-associated transferase 1
VHDDRLGAMTPRPRPVKPVALCIMAKMPAPGQVKTRLCPPLTPADAAELYRCFLLDKIEQVRTVANARPAIAYAGSRAVFASLAPDFLLVEQRGPDLGSRLHGSFEALLRSDLAGAVAVDADTPTLPTALLREAVGLVARPGPDVVLGPAEDGGYYLIGLRVPRADLFRDIAWSTATVMEETLRRARRNGLAATCLPAWFDVDTPADLERLRAALVKDGGAPRHTRRFLLGGASAARGGALGRGAAAPRHVARPEMRRRDGSSPPGARPVDGTSARGGPEGA